MVIKGKNIIISAGIILIVPSLAFAKEDLGYFYNDLLQEKIGKTYALTYDKNYVPFILEDYITVESVLAEKDDYISEIENPYYCLEKSKNFSLCDIHTPLTRHSSFKKAGHLYLDNNKVEKKLKEIAGKINREPENGRLKIGDDGRAVVYAESKDGLKLNIDKSYSAIKSRLIDSSTDGNIPLVIDIKKPEIFTDNIENYGINQLIAHGQSNFKGSPANRIHNIKVALERFDGVLIKPGEEFSFTTILGEVDGEHGYKEELVIKNNETIPEFGGGVCQVSTTVFRAALNGGLKITERHNHAYPVQYYAPQGTDATIYVPKPDLKFVNDTSSYILIQTKIEGTILTIDFYGTSDGRTAELDGPHVTERTPDGKMKTILTQRVKDASGNVVREQSFKSFYDNPDNYHRNELLKEKPDDWSKKQWKDYKKQHNIP